MTKIRGMAWEIDRDWSAHEIIDLVLASELTQASKREPSPYALGHFLDALDSVRESVRDGSDVAAFRSLKTEAKRAYLLPLTRWNRWIDAVIERAQC